MSRIGKQPVQIPDKVKVDIKDTLVRVEGPKGKVEKTFAPVVKIVIEDKKSSRYSYRRNTLLKSYVRNRSFGYRRHG